MDRNILPLHEVPLNTLAEIKSLNCNGHIRRRFLDLGFIPGTILMPLFKSPFGDPTAYQIRGILLAIRKEDADSILVSTKY